MLITAFVLVFGIVLMAMGGKISSKYSNYIMRARVVLQFLAIGLLFVLFAKHK
jgi:hypothetical protein